MFVLLLRKVFNIIRAAMLACTLIGHRSQLTWFVLRSLFFLIVYLPVMYWAYKKMKKVAQMVFYGRGFLSRRFLNAYLMLNAISVGGLGGWTAFVSEASAQHINQWGKANGFTNTNEHRHTLAHSHMYMYMYRQYIPDCWELASTDKHTQPKLW